MITFKEIKDSVLHLLFPHICAGCGNDVLPEETSLCLRCIDAMPETGFASHPENTVEKIFWGRLPLVSATGQFFFTKESLMQRLMHQFKYKANSDLGFQLGSIMGHQLKSSSRFDSVDALIPLPLFKEKEKRRGYNQAAVLCDGMAESMQLPVLDKAVLRPQHTDTQTKKGRIERWENMEGKFILADADAVRGKHILLVDDVVTTGATLEACGLELLKVGNIKLSIATLCVASR
jgi:ComF family protein